ncbi:condensation domain-containing protein [Actinomadura mexicana]|uniref:Condensation domain-containing protein n=1 Tax=Actinomadura mexicana TaxID=134959 RepID=A0A239EF41_9ACTN|nr:condensation domain-containing protein [Actinomadura mexicana]SNS43266.1 Condensation domain-containing protein [Actinomadura mexicana]
MTRPGHHAIPFAGAGAGEHPCTWGQLDMWREMEWAGDPAHGNVVGGGFLPSGHTTDRLLRVVGELVERYESLRTGFRPSDDGRLVQRVAAAGELDVEVRELDGDPVSAAREWVAASQARPYDLAGGVPFRVCVGTGGGEPRLVVLGMPHVTADLAGSRVLFDELVRGLEGRAPAAPPGLQPAERAAWERSAAGQRALHRSLEYWRRAVAAAPEAGFAVARHAPESPRYRTGGLTSRAVPRALDLLAARYGVSTSHVLLAAVATLVGRYTGERRCLVRVVVGNRGRPELRNAVGTVSQEVAAVVDLSAHRFGDMVRAARTSALNAMRHGQYDPDLAAGIVAEAGVELDVYFNDMWTATRNGKGAPGGRYEGVMDETVETRFEWGEQLDRASVRFFFESVEVVEDPAAVTLNLLTDTAYVPSPDLRAFLFAVEELLAALVADDGPPLDEIRLRNGP